MWSGLSGFAQDSLNVVASIGTDSTGAGITVASAAPATPVVKDSTGIAADTIGFRFFHDEYNYIEFYDRTALSNFFNKWKDDSTPKITIAHFGDSHIQPGIFSGEVRKFMQTQKGEGGYGLVFPYSAAKTYSPLDYKTVHYGKWQYSKALEPRPRLPLGVSGMTIRTIDPAAGFNITFREALPAHYKRLKLFFKPGPQSFDFRVLTRNHETVVPAASYPEDMPFTEIIIPDSTNFIHIQLLKTRDEQLNFEFYGISLESEQNRGLVYHQLGVGGAPYTAVLEQVMIDTQLPALMPDLVILDYGTNDFLYSQMIPAQLGRQIVQTINWIKQLAPGTSILLTSTQDMYRRGANVAAAKEFSNMMRKIAKEQNCGFYDWYRVSGGQYAMAKWVSARLARPDYIHLTKEGYLLKGRLFTQAFNHTYKRFAENGLLDSLIMEGTSGINIDSTLIANEIVIPNLITTRHKIRDGETLSGIADKYNVSVGSLMARNNLKNSRIVAGKTLIIDHRPLKANSTAVASVAQEAPVKPTIKPDDPNVIQHKVVSGDTLGHIAEKYHVSVKDIKRMNGLRSSRIIEGKVLLIQVK
ncbi:MAG TPA: LysM peptidoglycan-binding domain-containing protein [Cyclobacteriaceae bacterium]|nr:LysM peptidoglycan-binding domain-containing protein [Cyclobacteriaceae bacterium]